MCCSQKDNHDDWPYVDSKKTLAANITAILTAVDQGKYFMCNLPDDMSHVTPDISKLIDLRQQHQKQEWWDSAFLVQDPAKATLWLLGNEVCGTRFHLDWTEANNVAWATQGKPEARLA